MHTYVSGDDGSGSVHKWWRDVSWGVTNPQSRLPCLNIHRGIDRRSKFFGTYYYAHVQLLYYTVTATNLVWQDSLWNLFPNTSFVWFALGDRRSGVHVGIICLDFQYTTNHSGSRRYGRGKKKTLTNSKKQKTNSHHQLLLVFPSRTPIIGYHTPAKKDLVFQ